MAQHQAPPAAERHLARKLDEMTFEDREWDQKILVSYNIGSENRTGYWFYDTDGNLMFTCLYEELEDIILMLKK